MQTASNSTDHLASSLAAPRPLLKWAGGKTQLLDALNSRVPSRFGRYIEPFIGGGALFFSMAPEDAVIADSNPELVNLYRSVAKDVDAVIAELRTYENSEEVFYATRSLDWNYLSPVGAAARTIFLNRTCYSGLYRVNKAGGFNVPFGKYQNPKILDEANLRAAAQLLRRTEILEGDYKHVLKDTAQEGDLVFLDPPYLPISEMADFKRYTKEQFHERDHHELAEEVRRLHDLGCHVILTNSNHPLVHKLFGQYDLEIVKTKRHINSKPAKRSGEDVIVNVPRKQKGKLESSMQPLDSQTLAYPSTRFMGSKNKLLPHIWEIASQFEYDNVIDLFSGSGIVGYMFKAKGKSVFSNDYMAMSATFTKAMVENSYVTLSEAEALGLVDVAHASDGFVSRTFQGLYFKDDENEFIDSVRAGIKKLQDPYKRAIATSALMRACLKKRPRGIFTYVGHRYDDGRLDLTKTFREQFLEAVLAINRAVFDNGRQNESRHGDAMSASPLENSLVYIDPPYYSPLSDNEYVRRYHFVEGIAREWQGVEIQENTKTKKFKSYPTPFSSRLGAFEAFDALFEKFRESTLLVSYSSNSQPSMDEIVSLLSKYKEQVDVVPVAHKYSFGNQASKVGDNMNSVQEYLFVASDRR